MRRSPTWAAALAALLVIAASIGMFGLAAPSATADGSTPATPLPASRVEITRNVAYATVDDVTLTLDIYASESPAAGRPGIILIHGGAWGSGQAKDLDTEGKLIAREGWVAFSVNYRLADDVEHPWPDSLTDVQRATRWIGAHAGDYGVDNQKLAAMGLSAGGHLAVLLAELGTETDGSGQPFDDPNPPVRLEAAVAWSPPTRLAGLVAQGDGGDPTDCRDNKKCGQFWSLPLVSNFMKCKPDECPEDYIEASPDQRATAMTAPIWLANGTDEIVGLPQAEALDDALTAAGVDHHLEVLPGSQHAAEYESKVWNDVMPWLAERLGVVAPAPISFTGRSVLLSPVVVISIVAGLALLIVLLAVALRDDEGEL